MQETECPQCGEWLGVPPEFADRPIRCGACGRVISPHERTGSSSPPPPPPYRGSPRFPDDDTPGARPSSPNFPDRDDDREHPPRRKGVGLWWLWLLLAFGGFGCCGCCGLFAYLGQLNQWKPYTAKDGAFTADFPGDPVYATKPFQWKDEKEGTSHEYAAVQLMNAQAFGVQYVDLPKSLKGVRPETLLKYALEDLKTSHTNFTVLDSTDVTVNGFKGKDIEGTLTDKQHGVLQVYARTLVVGDRVFTLVAFGKDRGKLAPQKDRFFKSFKPADPPEKDKAKPADPKEK